MIARRLNPIALVLGIAAMLGIGWVMLTMTDPRQPLSSAVAPLQVYDMAPPPPADMRLPSIDISMAPAAPPPPPVAPAAPGATPRALATTVPRIAYSYGYAFRLPASAVATVQERHLELCRSLGAARCRVVGLHRGTGEDGAAAASLELQVAAAIADPFGRRLVALAAGAGGEAIERTVSTEDLSRQMVDSEARIRTREVLIRRLTWLLETRSGNIQQAVEAERAINTAQEELEAARAWLADMRSRVAMSDLSIEYRVTAAASPEARGPLARSVANVGDLFVESVAALVLVVGALLPWLALLGLVFLAVRAIRRRGEAAPAQEPPEETAIQAVTDR